MEAKPAAMIVDPAGALYESFCVLIEKASVYCVHKSFVASYNDKIVCEAEI